MAEEAIAPSSTPSSQVLHCTPETMPELSREHELIPAMNFCMLKVGKAILFPVS